MLIFCVGFITKLLVFLNIMSQIKELQENLKKEILAKTELSTKLADAELSILKYKNELTKNSSLISDLQATNQSIKVIRAQ